MEEDKVPLSPRTGPLDKIVGKKFQDLLDEAVVRSNKKRKKKKKKMPPLLLQEKHEREKSDDDESKESLAMGRVNLAADLEQLHPLPTRTRRDKAKKVLAPIRPPRSLEIPQPRQEQEQEQEETTPAVPLQQHEIVDPKSPSVSSHSSGRVCLVANKSTARSGSLSGGASLNSTPETKTRRRRRLKEHQPVEMVRLKSADRRAQLRPKSGDAVDGPGDADAQLGVRVHVVEVPLQSTPAAGVLVKTHVLDVETGDELRVDAEHVATTRCTGLVSAFTGKVATVEETLVFDVPLHLALHHDVLLLFQIVVPKLARYSSCYAKLEVQERCVGWAFLKLRSGASNGRSNTDCRLRLQIFEPHLALPKLAPAQNFKTVYGWWCKGPWKKTRCSMFVTVAAASAAAGSLKSNAATAEILARNDELGAETTSLLRSESSLRAATPKISNQGLERVLVRGEGQLCKVPERLLKSVSPPTTNCLSVSFSESGHLLAAASDHSILVFAEATQWGLKCVLQGHEGLVYSVAWFQNHWLLSASADCLAVVWDVAKQTMAWMLPHPSFVYCAQFLSAQQNLVVTGGKDKTLRVWRKSDDDAEYDLWQELDGHQGFVTCVSFDAGSTVLYSSDSEGVVLSWERGPGGQDWRLQREFLVGEMRGVCINALAVHPNGKRIYVYARDSVVRMLDVVTGVLLQTYLGALAHKIQSGLCLSPCGSLLVAGSEDGSVVAWQADTGRAVACVPATDCPPATALAFHPHAHLLAVGYFGRSPLNIWAPGAHAVLVDERVPADYSLKNASQQNTHSTEHLRLQDIIARIDRVLLTQAAN